MSTSVLSRNRKVSLQLVFFKDTDLSRREPVILIQTSGDGVGKVDQETLQFLNLNGSSIPFEQENLLSYYWTLKLFDFG